MFIKHNHCLKQVEKIWFWHYDTEEAVKLSAMYILNRNSVGNWIIEKYVLHLVTSVGQRKHYKYPFGIESQTFGFLSPMLYH